MSDPRRNIPGTDTLLALAPDSPLAPHTLKACAHEAQDACRRLDVHPDEAPQFFLSLVSSLEERGATTLTPVLNATGVVVHTNVGRAALAPTAIDAMVNAAGYVDVEMDLDSGKRSRNRGAGARDALLAAVPEAEDALVVNNGASALLLATAALAEHGKVAISRGELIEIGAGFRLPELIESAHVQLAEVGATNRTHPHDYERAALHHGADGTAPLRAILKVHPSNYRVHGFTSEATVAQLRGISDAHGLSLIVDTGSGLLRPDPTLADEPDAATALAHGADIVLFSGDKLLGGPQAGVILGKKEAVARLRKHPLARAVRVDKLRLAALEATVRLAHTPTSTALHADAAALRERTETLATRLAPHVAAKVVEHDGRVGGGGAPGVPLAGYAVALDPELAAPLRTMHPAVLGRVHDGALLLDLRCVPPERDADIADAVRAAARGEER